MVTSAHNKVVQAKFSNNGEQIKFYSRSQFLMEAGIGNYAGQTENCQRNRHPYLKGWVGTENRERNPENAVWEEVIRYFVQRSGHFTQTVH